MSNNRRSIHSCTTTDGRVDHRVRTVAQAANGRCMQGPNGTRHVGCHGHCGECAQAVMVCRAGRFHHA